MTNEQMARKWFETNTNLNIVESVAALLARRALEEAKWWAKNGTHGHVTDEAVERIAELERAAASKAAGGERT